MMKFEKYLKQNTENPQKLLIFKNFIKINRKLTKNYPPRLPLPIKLVGIT